MQNKYKNLKKINFFFQWRTQKSFKKSLHYNNTLSFSTITPKEWIKRPKFLKSLKCSLICQLLHHLLVPLLSFGVVRKTCKVESSFQLIEQNKTKFKIIIFTNQNNWKKWNEPSRKITWVSAWPLSPALFLVGVPKC